MNTYTFENFDYTDGYIILLPNTIFYRGIPNNIKLDNIIQDTPIYLGPENIAKMYGEQVYKLISIDSIRLIDIRKMKSIISIILDTIKTFNNELNVDTMRLMIAFGITIYPHQIKLLEQYNNMMNIRLRPEYQKIMHDKIEHMKKYNFQDVPHNPVMPNGVRIGETITDGYVMLILKELFKDICDGYIAPKLVSPYHPGNIAHEEIVLFNPKTKISMFNDNNTTISKEPITKIIDNTNTIININYKTINLQIRLVKGGNIFAYEDKNTFFYNKKLVKDGIKRAKRFIKSINIDLKSNIEHIDPHTSIIYIYLFYKHKKN